MSSTQRGGRPYMRAIWVMVVLAVLGGVGLLVAATHVPVYETVSSGGAQGTYTSSETLVAVNGNWVLVVLAFPLIASLLVGVALLRKRSGVVARVIAWTLTCIVSLFSMLALLTVGFAALPVAVCLIAACGFDLLRLQEGDPSVLA